MLLSVLESTLGLLNVVLYAIGLPLPSLRRLSNVSFVPPPRSMRRMSTQLYGLTPPLPKEG